jgi:hypothetical protein
MTGAELEQIRKFADAAKLTVSAYVRRRSLHFVVRSRYDETVINELRRVGGLLKSETLKLPEDERGPSWGILKLISVTVLNINKVATRELSWSTEIGKSLSYLRATARELEDVAKETSEGSGTAPTYTALTEVAQRIKKAIADIERVVATEIEESILARLEKVSQ